MCRLLTQCVAVPIWGVCQCWYALSFTLESLAINCPLHRSIAIRVYGLGRYYESAKIIPELSNSVRLLLLDEGELQVNSHSRSISSSQFSTAVANWICKLEKMMYCYSFVIASDL